MNTTISENGDELHREFGFLMERFEKTCSSDVVAELMPKCIELMNNYTEQRMALTGLILDMSVRYKELSDAIEQAEKSSSQLRS